MFKIVLQLIFIFLSTFSFAQVSSYSKYRNQLFELKKAMSYLEEDNLNQSALYFKKSLKIGPIDFYYSTQAAYVFSLIGDTINTIKVIENLPIKHNLFCNKDSNIYCQLNDDILNDTAISKILTSKKANNSLIKLNKRINYYRGKINIPLLNELKEMTRKDQEIRFEYMKYFGKTRSLIADSLNQLMQRIDSYNFVRFIEIIKIYGWPDMNKYGAFADYILWHCNINVDFLNKVALKAAKNKQLDWSTYEHFYKREYFYDGLFSNNGFEIKLLNRIKLKKGEIQAVFDFLEYYRIDVKDILIIYQTSDKNYSNIKKKIAELENVIRDYGINNVKINIKVDLKSNYLYFKMQNNE